MDSGCHHPFVHELLSLSVVGTPHNLSVIMVDGLQGHVFLKTIPHHPNLFC